MPVKIERHGGYCDYCLEDKGVFARGDDVFTKNGHKSREALDICKDCVETAYNMFQKKSLINRTLTMFSNIAKRLLDNNTKILIKAGFLSNDLQLTEKGEEVLLSTMLSANLETMVKEAEEVVAEQEKEA